MFSLIKKITENQNKKHNQAVENFKEEKILFQNKKESLLNAIKKATEDKDMLRKDILLKELSEVERKFNNLSVNVWGHIPKKTSNTNSEEKK